MTSPATARRARTVSQTLALDPEANIVHINGADNGLHVASTLAGLAVALGPRRDATGRR